jgi:hypothetical protein
VNHDDVGVIQGRGGSRLSLEALQALVVGGELLGKHLDCDFAAEPRISCLPDFAHPAGPERGEDFVGTEAAARGDRHGALEIREFSSLFTILKIPLSLLQR